LQSLETFGAYVELADLKFLEELAKGCKEIVEVGSFVGMSTSVLADSGAIVHCIDTWNGSPGDLINVYYEELGDDIYRAFCRNAGDKLFDTIRTYVGPSVFYASVWPRKVDLVFIDGAHDYENVKADIAAWTPHVKPGGILCGHDYGVSFLPGVKEAVDEINPDGVTNTVWWKRL
jgi:hypothetical protein